MKGKYDVVVVGAGPAGSLTAKIAAEKNLQVLLIERNQEIGVPVKCAEGVTKKVEKFIKVDKRCICTELTGANIYAPDGTYVTLYSSKVDAYILERRLFDKSLAIEAACAGADIRVNTYVNGLIMAQKQIKGVQVRSNGKDYRILADVVVGADGVESKIGRMAGIDTKLHLQDIDICAQYLMCGLDGNIDEHQSDFYLGSEVAPGGYAWVFPKGNGCANVGLGIRGNVSREGHRAADYLKRFVQRNFSMGSVITEMYGAVPVSGPLYDTVAEGLILVGDAARHVDPSTGGGILYAIQAGIIAGEVIAEAKEENDFSKSNLLKYEKRWKQSFGKELKKKMKITNFIQSLSDEELNTIAYSLPSEIEMDKKIGGLIVIKEIFRKNPKLITRFI